MSDELELVDSRHPSDVPMGELFRRYEAMLALLRKTAEHQGSADPYEDCGHGEDARALLASFRETP